MDENKREQLQKMGYRINRCCGNCEFATISKDGWGTCNIFGYSHKKHSDADRQLSINSSGVCGSHQLHRHALVRLGGFAEFMG